jgi:SAM-dependent methyltransferase
VVRLGWNRVSYRYRPRRATSDFFGHLEDDYRAWLDPVLEAVPPGSKVLDLGCGNGVPAARVLAERFRVIGVDISDVQVRRARRLVPRARFVRADLAEVNFPSGAFAAVVSFYSLFHVPREEQRPLFRKVARWLGPDGWFVAILGRTEYEGTKWDWLGSDARMLWSQHDAATYRRWFRAEGFRILRDEFIPEGDGGHQLFVTRKGRSRPARRASARKPVAR